MKYVAYPKNSFPNEGSLHSLANETANCGMGAIVQTRGKQSHSIVQLALTSVCNMEHRGGMSSDQKTGDGSGILTQIPFPIFEETVKAWGKKITKSTLGVGVFFLPKEENIDQIKLTTEEILTQRKISVLGWREVPLNLDALGKIAFQTSPQIEQLLVQCPSDWNDDHYERQLFLVRRELEKAFETVDSFYIPSFSCRLISYKALASPVSLKDFYQDFSNPKFETAIALYHQRFSTNTFPSWTLSQPFRRLCHNGEINTIRGNRNWMAGRESFFQASCWGKSDLPLLQNLLSEKESDSASLDHALELLSLSGKSLEYAMCLLVHPAFEHDRRIPQNIRDFYEYTQSFSEAWDGPAGLVYTDGKKVVASLDRNGLRPSRYVLTENDILYIGSESGAITFDESEIIRRGRIGPGQMMSIDLSNGQISDDLSIKTQLASAKPYGDWLNANKVELSNFVNSGWEEETFDPITLSKHQMSHGLTEEDLQMVFPSMMKQGQEAVYSMGDDIPLSPLSIYPKILFTYFKQLFAQVTNPPIDPIREWQVMSLNTHLGQELNLLSETANYAKLVKLDSPILFDNELIAIQTLTDSSFKSQTFDITWQVNQGKTGLEQALDRLCEEIDKAIEEKTRILILSDRNLNQTRVSIPSLLATGAIHQHLVRRKTRLRVSLIIDTGEARDTHQLACLFGFGATAVCPYIGYATVKALSRKEVDSNTSEALKLYRLALEKGLMKIMSKMGISVLNAYQGAQIFAAIGIAHPVMDRCFSQTQSRIKGIGFEQIALDSLERHRLAWENQSLAELGDPGYNRYRKKGERHALTTHVIKNFHTYIASGKKEDYDDYVKANLNTHPIGLKHLLSLVPSSSGPIPIEEVEPVEAILKRFTTAAMSLGALSPEAHETLAIAMNAIGGKSNSGEGGEDARRFDTYPNGDLARSSIKQVASGRFGVSAHYLANCDEIEIKMAQGAKPGEGGQLPAHKVNSLIAMLRNTQPGVQLISPPPHHDIYSIEDLAQLIYDLKEVNPQAKVTVKLVSSLGVGTIASGVAKANADVILISGHEGGTAASPLSSTKFSGLPWEIGLAETQQTLMLNNLRQRVTLRTDGGLKEGRDVIVAAILGAEEYNFGTIAMIAMGCVYVRKCHLNNCPVGVATTHPKYRAKFKGSPQGVINFFYGVANEVRQHLADLGLRNLNQLIGQTQFLKQREVPNHPKANTLDLSPLLKDLSSDIAKALKTEPKNIAKYRKLERNNGIPSLALDHQILKELMKHTRSSSIPDAIETFHRKRSSLSLSYSIKNIHRNTGTRLSGHIAKTLGANPFSHSSLQLNFTGSAGQSFGTFLVQGLHLNLRGEANDYVGKGMSGGTISIAPVPESKLTASENSIAGNTCLYGATGGNLFVCGQAGERFGVRNSGAGAVVEGVGDHGCEYMTGGTVIVLGDIGQNFAAGMSGGTAYLYSPKPQLPVKKFINLELVELRDIKKHEENLIKILIQSHLDLTQSHLAQSILENWGKSLQHFQAVSPELA